MKTPQRRIVDAICVVVFVVCAFTILTMLVKECTYKVPNDGHGKVAAD